MRSHGFRFIESYYRANWADGIDLIGLSESGGIGFGKLYDPDAITPEPNDPDKNNPVKRISLYTSQNRP